MNKFMLSLGCCSGFNMKNRFLSTKWDHRFKSSFVTIETKINDEQFITAKAHLNAIKILHKMDSEVKNDPTQPFIEAWSEYVELTDFLPIDDVRYKDAQGNTALHLVAGNDFVGIAKHLLLRFADVNAKNYHGETPLHIATERGSLEMLKLLLRVGIDWPGERPSEMDSMLSADVNETDRDGWTSLHNACRRGDLERVKILQVVSKPNLMDDMGRTPLDLARIFGHTEMINLLTKSNTK